MRLNRTVRRMGTSSILGTVPNNALYGNLSVAGNSRLETYFLGTCFMQVTLTEQCTLWEPVIYWEQ